ncbi:hypothetical protein WR25_18488 [Diploscapter pachys]|uniref:Ubiquitin-like domain-containing protein n=1 Tax=Diploscapter pachys TaxID=2018661 RepID=A0A2A2JTY2_9BILA|nr:hypothetical protein WR25_18488 [Diploscapter pachys]
MKIKIKLELELEIEEDDTIRDVKWKVNQRTGVPVEQLIIDKLLAIPPFSDSPPLHRDPRLYDHMRLGDLAVREWSNRNLMLDVRHHVPRELTIFVVTPRGVTLHVKALDNWTASRLKRKPLLLYHRLMEAGVSDNITLELIEPDVGPMTIAFKTFVGIDYIHLNVRAESTIKEVKEMLHATRMLPFRALKLTYIGYGGALDDIYSLAEYGIKNGAEISVTQAFH